MYENPDGSLMADHEKRQVPPATRPVQERHRVHPPADHDKLAWCMNIVGSLNIMIAKRRKLLGKFSEDARPLEGRLRHMLGDAAPFGDNRLWKIMRLGKVSKQQPHHGTWKEVYAIYREWEIIDDRAAPVAERLVALVQKRRRYLAIQVELESNIEHWEGV